MLVSHVPNPLSNEKQNTGPSSLVLVEMRDFRDVLEFQKDRGTKAKVVSEILNISQVILSEILHTS